MISQTLTVSDFIEKVKTQLEDHFSSIWIRGEISQVTRASSGHIYFVVKDTHSSIRALMFKNKAYAFQTLIKEGAQVDLLAIPSIYEARGEFQLIVEAIRQAGSGQLYEQFLRLKSKLARDGLFDEHLKKPLPQWPKTVGIVTSLQAAALKDVISVFRRRNPGIRLIVYPASVQGDTACAEIIAMLNTANQQALCDALIVCRGGGSFEDMSVFNDEGIARAIYASHIPVVSAIGHETDVTIADFVADYRAATPTAAAEILSPCVKDVQQHLWQLIKRLRTGFLSNYYQYMNRLTVLKHRLLSPQDNILFQSQLLKHHIQRLTASIHRHYRQKAASYYQCRGRILNPVYTLNQKKQQLNYLTKNLNKPIYHTVFKIKNNINSLKIRLENANPDQILSRGYSITYDQKGNIISDISNVLSDDIIVTKIANGIIDSKVQNVRKKVSG